MCKVGAGVDTGEDRRVVLPTQADAADARGCRSRQSNPRVYDAFHLELAVLTSESEIPIIAGDTVAELAATVEAAMEHARQDITHPGQTDGDLVAEALGARGGARTRMPEGSRF